VGDLVFFAILGLLVLAIVVSACATNLDRVANPVAPRSVNAPKRVHYRTRDGRTYYSFSIEEQPRGEYRSYIVAQPGYGDRLVATHTTHRLRDETGRLYICWSKPIRSEQDALRVSAAWAEATQEYIKSGQTF
jgi:hypothetical protein